MAGMRAEIRTIAVSSRLVARDRHGVGTGCPVGGAAGNHGGACAVDYYELRNVFSSAATAS